MPRKPKEARRDAGLPSKQQVLDYLRTAPAKSGKREIARAFGIKGGDRIALKTLLTEMAGEGLLSGNRKAFKERGHLPPVAVLQIVARDKDGELIAEPAVWDTAEGERPRALVLAPRGGRGSAEPALGQGDRILARLTRLEDADVFGYRYEAEPIKRLPREQRRLLGIFRAKAGGGGLIDPVDRKELREWPIAAGDEGGAKTGDLVRFELSRAHRYGVEQARIAETLGNPQDQRKISLIAVHAHGIPDEFPHAVLAEVGKLEPPRLAGRTDLRALDLVTIDPVDARDHDDAVHAAPDADAGNGGGFVVHVAIADVAHYVRPGTRLDREAQMRGNSVYFPDRVVPMLPEPISNDLCSLKEREERPCLAVRLIFDRHGNKKGHTFLRAMMRSAAKLSYEEAQAAVDGQPSARAAPLLDSALKPLWSAYAALAAARDRRAPLDLDLPERKIVLDAQGQVERVTRPERLEAHRLIEEFMIQANVAAAETLEARRAAVVYRVHDAPSKEKLTALREFLESLGLKLPGAGSLQAGDFNRVLQRAKSMPVADLINEIVLRSQSQAVYAAENLGHFGLHLRRYAHFTSPIRRYADLLVHRSLIRALGLGAGALADEEAARLGDIAQAISDAERRAMAAERETTDRLIAAYLADRVGAEFDARISGVTRSGLFVRLLDTGADGFVPAATIGNDYYRHHEDSHALIGDRTGETYRLGDGVRVKLVEAIPTAGALRFEMLSEGKRQGSTAGALPKGRRFGRGHRRPRSR
ncbi:MAG: ribonuclease R [Alphaproteobacteria bacterium]|nr:MAG: ribonuclease R [Alphaproteobacteria bacterium]